MEKWRNGGIWELKKIFRKKKTYICKKIKTMSAYRQILYHIVLNEKWFWVDSLSPIRTLLWICFL